MKKSNKVVFIVAVIMLIAFSCSTAFAASYSGTFDNGYRTSQSTAVSSFGYIDFTNNTAQHSPDGGTTWFYYTRDGSSHNVCFKTTGQLNPDGTSTYINIGSKITYYNTSYRFNNPLSDSGRGYLRFDNDYYPWYNDKIKNAGTFY